MLLSLLAEISQRPSGVDSNRVVVFECPTNRRAGFGAAPPDPPGSSQTSISPRLFPAATRFGPTKLTAVTQSASHGRFHASAALLGSADCAAAIAGRSARDRIAK